MKEAVVGRNVGFFVGKLGQPDKREPRANNDLGSLCRECRVFTTGERPRGFDSLRHHGRT